MPLQDDNCRDLDVTSEPVFQSIWEYEVNEKFLNEFIRAYKSNGTWVKLFTHCPGYIKTELKRDIKNANRFVTVDYWQSFSAFCAMKQTIGDEYKELDKKCGAFTITESHIGYFYDE